MLTIRLSQEQLSFFLLSGLNTKKRELSHTLHGTLGEGAGVEDTAAIVVGTRDEVCGSGGFINCWTVIVAASSYLANLSFNFCRFCLNNGNFGVKFLLGVTFLAGENLALPLFTLRSTGDVDCEEGSEWKDEPWLEVEASVEKDTSWTLEISPLVKLEMCLSCNNLPLTKLYVSFLSRMSRTVEAMNSASSLVRVVGSRLDRDFALVLVFDGLVVMLGTRMILLLSVMVMP